MELDIVFVTVHSFLSNSGIGCMCAYSFSMLEVPGLTLSTEGEKKLDKYTYFPTLFKEWYNS